MLVVDPAKQRQWTRRCPTCGHSLEDAEAEPLLVAVMFADSRPPTKERTREVCGARMPISGETCGRMRDHWGGCRSKALMAEEAARRRKR